MCVRTQLSEGQQRVSIYVRFYLYRFIETMSLTCSSKADFTLCAIFKDLFLCYLPKNTCKYFPDLKRTLGVRRLDWTEVAVGPAEDIFCFHTVYACFSPRWLVQKKTNPSKISREHRLEKYFQEFEVYWKMMNE